MDILKNQVAVITGANRGIGLEIAKTFLSAGAIVIGASRSENGFKAELDSLAKTHSTSFVDMKLDIADEASIIECVKAIKEQFGRIDILVNNAGITKDKLIMRMTSEEFSSVIDTNLRGAFLMCRETINVMLKQEKLGNSPSIINMASIIGKIGNMGQANYSASKGGLIALTKSIAREVSSRNIRCNAIAPGFIESDMTNSLSASVKDAIMVNIPLKRMGSTKDIANGALFLASDLSSYITGHVLDINGGMLMD